MSMSLQNLYSQSLERTRASFSKVRTKLRVHLKLGSESALRIRRRQFFVAAGLVLSISAFIYGILSVLFDKGPVKNQVETVKPVTTHIATAPSQIDLNEARWHKLDVSIKNLRKEVSEVKKLVYDGEQVPSNNENTTENNENKENLDAAQSQDSHINDTHADDSRFQEIQERLAFLETERDAQPQRPLNTLSAQNLPSDVRSGGPIEEAQDGRVIQKLVVSLVDHSKNLKTVETTIPAGAFAKTVLLSGLDASSAMNASSDPRPMLLRIIDHGTLPRRFQSDLKDCHCTAGAYGDLSSERVYARLEKLTCIERKTGEIIETQVAGYVAGSDGKAGVRGVVASKDGQFLARSLMGGIFSGLSNVANPQNRRAQVNPFAGAGGVPGAGGSIAGPSIGENFMSGMSSGATTALDRLSQYYIDRAEQLQPVIQIAAGQVVDIVFTEGTSFSNQLSVISDQKKEKGEQ
ncbi:MAG: TraB/VirB10 family protein [Bacillota bacterium]|nr:TraB/VirB10 family protein [Bacillota bacterium]